MARRQRTGAARRDVPAHWPLRWLLSWPLRRSGDSIHPGDVLEGDAQLVAEAVDALVPIELVEGDAADARVGDQLEAAEAGGRGHVDVRPLQPYAVAGGLHDRVGLRVDRAHAVAILHEVPLVVAMGDPPDGPVVARRQDHAVADDDGA